MEQIIKCPHCEADINVEVEMYMDDGDECYDLFIKEEEAEEVGVEPLVYKCTSCQNNFRLELDEDFWGNEDIPVLVKKI